MPMSCKVLQRILYKIRGVNLHRLALAFRARKLKLRLDENNEFTQFEYLYCGDEFANFGL
jgi:hypothetical protein